MGYKLRSHTNATWVVTYTPVYCLSLSTRLFILL